MYYLATPKIFGFGHLLFIFVFIVLSVVSIYLVKKNCTTEASLKKVVKGFGWFLLAMIIFSRVSITVVSKRWFDIFPDSFCATSSLLFALAIIIGKKDNIVLHGFAYIGVMGGIATLIYPDFITQSTTYLYLPTISGLLHHSVSVYLFFLILCTGYLKPTIRKWYVILLCGCIFMTYGLLLYQLFNLPGAMLIGQPVIPNTIFYWYVIGPLFLLAYYIFILIWEYCKNKRQTSL